MEQEQDLHEFVMHIIVLTNKVKLLNRIFIECFSLPLTEVLSSKCCTCLCVCVCSFEQFTPLKGEMAVDVPRRVIVWVWKKMTGG